MCPVFITTVRSRWVQQDVGVNVYFSAPAPGWELVSTAAVGDSIYYTWRKDKEAEKTSG